MTDATIFSDGTTPPNGEAAKPVITLPDSVKDMIGEGKKYASVEKALEALAYSQRHIETLESETRTLREKVAEAASTEDVVRTVQDLLAAERAKTGVTAPVVDEAALSGLLDRKLTEREQRVRETENVSAVKSALLEKHGDKADEFYRERAKELGVTTEFLNSVVASSPAAARELLGLKPATASSAGASHSRGTIRTEALDTTNTGSGGQQKKSVMGGATTSELVDRWKSYRPA